MLDEFYAVTRTSVYRVRAEGEWRASAVKIALQSESVIPLGKEIAEGGMIAICKNLQAYIPEKYGATHPQTGYERDLMKINTRWWGWHSSSIVALFKEEQAAIKCAEAGEKKPRDVRWVQSTEQVLAEIGEEHPSFFICHSPKYDLMKSPVT